MKNGRSFEKEVLGIEVEWEEEPLYVEFFPAMWQVLFKQPNEWNPLSPSTKLGRKLLDAIIKALYSDLEGYCDEWLREGIVLSTGLYVALGTPADYYHQTDAIVFCDIGKVTAMVTVDLTVNEFKKENEDLRDNHVIITDKHFTDFTFNGKRRLDMIAGVISDQLIDQLLEQRLLKVPAPLMSQAQAC